MGEQEIENLTNLFRFVRFLIVLILNLAFSSPRTDYRVCL